MVEIRWTRGSRDESGLGRRRVRVPAMEKPLGAFSTGKTRLFYVVQPFFTLSCAVICILFHRFFRLWRLTFWGEIRTDTRRDTGVSRCQA